MPGAAKTKGKAKGGKARGKQGDGAAPIVLAGERALVLPGRGMEALGEAYHSLADAEARRTEYVRAHCAEQIEALERAQRELGERMAALSECKEYDALCDRVDAQETKLQQATRAVRRSFEDAACAVLDDRALTQAEKQARLDEMMASAQRQLKELEVPFGALVRAQVLTLRPPG